MSNSKHYKYLSVWIITFMFFWEHSHAQKRALDELLVMTNVSYTEPPGYLMLDESKSFYPVSTPGKGYVLSTMLISLQNDSSDIRIGIILVPLIQRPEGSLLKLYPDFKLNDNFKNTVKTEANTTISAVYYLDEKELASVNASKGATYNLRMDKLFLDKYSYCKVLTLQRDNISQAELLYFYTEESKREVDKEMKRTFRVLKFLPDEGYKSPFK